MQVTATSSKRRKTGAIATYCYLVTQVLVNLLYVPLLLSTIGKAEYGLYQIIGSLIAYLGIINTTLSAGATRFYSKYLVLNDEDNMANVLGELRRVYRRVAVIVIVVTIALMPVVRVAYGSSFTLRELNEACWMLAILAANVLVTMENTISVAAITSHEHFVFLKGTMTAALAVQLIIVVASVHIWPSALTVCVAQLITNTLCCLVQRLFAIRKLGMDDRLRCHSEALAHDLVSFSGAIIIALVADQVFWKTDQLILGWMYGTEATAAYAVGMQVVSAYMALGSAVSSVFLPRVSELWHLNHDIGAISDLFVRVSRLALYPLLAVLLGFAVFGLDFVRLWAGDGCEEAYWVAMMVMVPLTVDVSQNLGLTILQVMNAYGFRAKMYLLAALLNVVGTFVLASLYQGYGAAASSAAAIVLSSGIVLNLYYRREVGLDMKRWWSESLREAVPLVVMSLIAGAMWYVFPWHGSWIALFLGICVYAVAFTCVSWKFSANSDERNRLMSAARKVSRT